MKKIKRMLVLVLVLVLAVLMCSACSSGVSQEEYDAVVAERDELQAQYDALEQKSEVEKKIVEYKVSLEKEHETISIILDIIENLGADMSEVRVEAKQIYDTVKAVLDTYEDVDDVVIGSEFSVDLSGSVDEIDSMMDTWNTFVSTIKESLYNSFTSGNSTAAQEPKNVLVYEDEKVKISFTGVTSSGVEFMVENLTDVNITIQADSVSINGQSANDITMSDDVAPQSRGKVVAKCSDFAGITEVTTVGGQLRVVDFNDSFKTYDATFINVDVTE